MTLRIHRGRKKAGGVMPPLTSLPDRLSPRRSPYPMSYSRIFRYSVLRLMPSAVAASERLLS